jgi:hypothetical protein
MLLINPPEDLLNCQVLPLVFGDTSVLIIQISGAWDKTFYFEVGGSDPDLHFILPSDAQIVLPYVLLDIVQVDDPPFSWIVSVCSHNDCLLISQTPECFVDGAI